MPLPAIDDITIRRFAYQQVLDFAVDLLSAAGLERLDAEAASRHLLIADMRGVESHGMARMPTYISRLQAGLINPAGLFWARDPAWQLEALALVPLETWLRERV